MRKQNVRILSMDGSFTVRHVTPDEGQRLVDQGSARIVSRNPMKIRLIEHAQPSNSSTSKSSLTPGDMKVLTSMPKDFIRKLDGARIQEMSPSAIASLQRLAGWNLIPRNAALENAEQA